MWGVRLGLGSSRWPVRDGNETVPDGTQFHESQCISALWGLERRLWQRAKGSLQVAHPCGLCMSFFKQK